MKINIKCFTLVILLLPITSVLHAQFKEPVFSFNSVRHDFGKILETDGTVHHRFIFTNTGKEPIIISNIESSCGCMIPDWTKEPVLPGKKGHILTSFDPGERSGKFEHTITVSANTNPAFVLLRIAGEVIPRAKTLSELYPARLGLLNAKSNHLSLGRITKNEKLVKEFEVANTTDNTLNVSFSGLPDHIKVSTMPPAIQAQSTGTIVVGYNSELNDSWGFSIDRVNILFDEVSTGKQHTTLAISANIVEDFSGLTEEELAMAPRIQVLGKEFNFGNILQGQLVEHDFLITNMGKSNLIIRKVQSSCGCTVVEPEKNVIKPGDSTILKAKFNATGRYGRQNKTIHVITNDPKNTQITLWVKGQVNVK